MRITRVHADRYSKTELEKLDMALELFSQAVNSVQFLKTIEAHSTFDTKLNLTTKQIYNLIMSGDEAYTDEGVDNEADLDLTLDLRISTDAIGYTIENRIYTFRNFFHQLLTTKLAGHYAHEYCHTLGFSDPQNLTDISRNVPYEVGRIIEELAIANHRVFITQPSLLESPDLSTFRNASIATTESISDSSAMLGNTIPSTASIKQETHKQSRSKEKRVTKKKRKNRGISK